jgi:aspartokinase
MVTVSHLVKKYIDDNPFLEEGLSQNLISNANLAEQLKPKIEEELGKIVKESAIVMALRRYSEELVEKAKKTKKFDFSGEVVMKTNICDINLVKSPSLLTKLKSIYTLVEFEKGDVLNIILGSYEVSIVISEKYKNKLLTFLKDEKILNIESNLTSLTITYSKDFFYTPGVIFTIIKKLAWENVNIFEIVSTMTELTFILSDKDSVKAYGILKELMTK